MSWIDLSVSGHVFITDFMYSELSAVCGNGKRTAEGIVKNNWLSK
jgi:hypothetical protein